MRAADAAGGMQRARHWSLHTTASITPLSIAPADVRRVHVVDEHHAAWAQQQGRAAVAFLCTFKHMQPLLIVLVLCACSLLLAAAVELWCKDKEDLNTACRGLNASRLVSVVAILCVSCVALVYVESMNRGGRQ